MESVMGIKELMITTHNISFSLDTISYKQDVCCQRHTHIMQLISLKKFKLIKILLMKLHKTYSVRCNEATSIKHDRSAFLIR